MGTSVSSAIETLTPIMVSLCLLVLELEAGTEQSDRQTDGRTSKTHSAAY